MEIFRCCLMNEVVGLVKAVHIWRNSYTQIIMQTYIQLKIRTYYSCNHQFITRSRIFDTLVQCQKMFELKITMVSLKTRNIVLLTIFIITINFLNVWYIMWEIHITLIIFLSMYQNYVCLATKVCTIHYQIAFVFV